MTDKRVGTSTGGRVVACGCHQENPVGHRSATAAKDTDPALWTTERTFGYAGGPDVVVLTQEGLARAFQVGAQCRRGPALDALEALANFDGEALFCVGTGPRLVPTELGRRFDQLAWGVLRSLGYVESVPPVHGEHGGGVRLTEAGRAAVLRGYAERESLLARCRSAARGEGDGGTVMNPRRVQRTRTKGGGMPAGAVYVGRPTKWGNPYRPESYGFENPDGTPAPFNEREARRMAVRDYEHQLRCGRLQVTVEDVRRELRGKDLACWCAVGAPCHADVLLEIANEAP